MAKTNSRSSSSSRGSRQPSHSPSRQSSVASSHPSGILKPPRGPTSHWHSGSSASQKRVSLPTRPGSQRSIISGRSSQPPASVPQPAIRSASALRDDLREDADHIIAAIDVKEKGKIGCAYYVAREERLLCMEDVPKGGFETIDRRML